jgi:2-amino-4-hydroxy-6-hydroxymethyldihydropteridine diphosphokinase
MPDVYLSLGSNLGERENNLRTAIKALSKEITLGSVSSLYETDPVGVLDQPYFLNLAVSGETSRPAEELLAAVKRIEDQAGRVPSFRWGPRVVDIDILLYDELTLETPELVIPHPEMNHRAFVLVPLAEIAPAIKPTGFRQTVRELRDELGDKGVRRFGAITA